MLLGKVLVIAGTAAGVLWWGISSHRETAAQHGIVNGVRPLIEACKGMGDSMPVKLHNKALVWDMASDGRSAVYGRLPSVLQATSSDSPITVFMVLGTRTVQVGTYSISKQPGYRQYVDVCVAYWPEKNVAGMGSIVSREPRPSRPVTQQPEYGDPNEPVVQWIAALPRT